MANKIKQNKIKIMGDRAELLFFFQKLLESLSSCLLRSSISVLRNWTSSQLKQPMISQMFMRLFDEVHRFKVVKRSRSD